MNLGSFPFMEVISRLPARVLIFRSRNGPVCRQAPTGDGCSVPENLPPFYARLPCDDYPPRRQAARAYYHVQALLPGAGTQVFIETIPRLVVQPCRAAIPSVGYQEHRRCWLACGHRIVEYDGFSRQASAC